MQPYDLYRVNWDADFREPSGLLTPLLHSSAIGHGGGNVSYRDETLDQLLDQARSESRPEHRAALKKFRGVVSGMPDRDARPRYRPRPPQPWDRRRSEVSDQRSVCQ